MKKDISWTFLALAAAWLLISVALDLWPNGPHFLTFAFVLVGWVISLCFHEFSHAVVARRFGDTTMAASGYLTLDPRKYMSGAASFLLPILALAMGGVAFPGGAVMIRTDLIRKPVHFSLIALAGPAATLACTIVVYLVAMLLQNAVSAPLFDALMLLAFYLMMAFVLNMLPVPGLDGFAALRPWLPKNARIRVSPQVMGVITLGLLALVYFQGYRIIMPIMYGIVGLLGIDPIPVFQGMDRFHFW